MFRYIRLHSQINMILLLACLFCLISVNSAKAQQDQSDIYTENDIPGISGIRMVASLLAVLALIVGGVFLLKKLTPYGGVSASAEHPISFLSRVSLGQKKSICLIKIADEILVVGLTNANISVLSKMNADEYYSKAGGNVRDVPAEYGQSFRKVLDKIGIRNRRTAETHKEGL